MQDQNKTIDIIDLNPLSIYFSFKKGEKKYFNFFKEKKNAKEYDGRLCLDGILYK